MYIFIHTCIYVWVYSEVGGGDGADPVKLSGQSHLVWGLGFRVQGLGFGVWG